MANFNNNGRYRLPQRRGRGICSSGYDAASMAVSFPMSRDDAVGSPSTGRMSKKNLHFFFSPDPCIL